LSRMSELSLAVEELRNCGKALLGVADSLAGLFGGDETEAQQPAPPAEKPIKLEDVRAVLADKSRAGLTAQVRELLQKHGVDKLSDIDPAEYPALLKEAEGLTDG